MRFIFEEKDAVGFLQKNVACPFLNIKMLSVILVLLLLSSEIWFEGERLKRKNTSLENTGRHNAVFELDCWNVLFLWRLLRARPIFPAMPH